MLCQMPLFLSSNELPFNLKLSFESLILMKLQDQETFADDTAERRPGLIVAPITLLLVLAMLATLTGRCCAPRRQPTPTPVYLHEV
jgi:hypothetical protein